MQFTAIVATVFAVAVAAVPQSPPSYNGTSPIVPSNGTSTGSPPTGTGSPIGSSSPIPSYVTGGSAGRLSTGAMGLVVVGGLAMAL